MKVSELTAVLAHMPPELEVVAVAIDEYDKEKSEPSDDVCYMTDCLLTINNKCVILFG